MDYIRGLGIGVLGFGVWSFGDGRLGLMWSCWLRKGGLGLIRCLRYRACCEVACDAQ